MGVVQGIVSLERMPEWRGAPEHFVRTYYDLLLDPTGIAAAGQIELYSHFTYMRQLVEALQQWDFKVCGKCAGLE